MKKAMPEEVASLLNSESPPLLFDVRLADDHEASHILGSVNNCVFEVAFLDRLPELAPDKARTIIVYGASQESAEARVAAEKLER
jgi:rhodanese-related sulfurtransferase